MYPALHGRAGPGAGAGRALLVAVLLVTLVGGGFLGAGGSGLVALLGQHSQPRSGKLCLASDFPTTGDYAPEGKSLQNAVQLAVVQYLNLGAGYTLDVAGYNDASKMLAQDPEQGAQNVADMVHNACIMGMGGPYISPMAPPEMTSPRPPGWR
jgi:ABC-type branched-subunit amino acid transport system substrate-binding protein